MPHEPVSIIELRGIENIAALIIELRGIENIAALIIELRGIENIAALLDQSRGDSGNEAGASIAHDGQNMAARRGLSW